MAAETGAMPAKASQPLSAQIGKGSTWDEAVNDIAWSDGDVLVVGSSSLSRRLNAENRCLHIRTSDSRATKIRATPCARRRRFARCHRGSDSG